jgi:hypothetical protein
MLLEDGGIRGRDRMVGGFTTTCAIRAYHHTSCEYEYRSWWGVLDTTLCDKVTGYKMAVFSGYTVLFPTIKLIDTI